MQEKPCLLHTAFSEYKELVAYFSWMKNITIYQHDISGFYKSGIIKIAYEHGTFAWIEIIFV